ncbi:RloB family protein [Streptomyces pini]|uniref:RloB-like protein n=1 Tax=Streptomyces pini TaxID=1520580 RepID=A0A1I4GAG8_9ACTN|nr:RloB family protein [Streptomyces pini]SFL26121.1 RloB-like protein [Streptomyces pini]
MARTRGKDDTRRRSRRDERSRKRAVYIYAEGEVTEEEYLDLVMEHGAPADPARRTTHHICTTNAATKDRKPITLVDKAVDRLREEERKAKRAGLKPKDWAWPQVWCVFDRDDHPQIPTAFSRARKAGVHVAYSHPCFELWRLLHYRNHTTSMGGVCNDAGARLRGCQGFAQTYGANVRSVDVDRSKHVMPGQIKGRYEKARDFAKKLNEQHTTTDQTRWDPYSNVWELVENGLGIARY